MDNIKVNNLTIDYDKCVGCLKCTRVCIWTMIEAAETCRYYIRLTTEKGILNFEKGT